MIEYTMTLGEILQVVTVIVAVVSGWMALRADIKILRNDHDKLEQRVEVYEERQTEALRVFGDKMSKGFDRIYDKLDEKADKE